MTLEIFVTDDIAACHALRRRVFIEEQNVSEDEELDDLDSEAIHILAAVDKRPVGSARIILVDTVGKIGRVCVLKDQRGTGLGAKLIQKCLDVLREQPNIKTAKLGSQTHAIGFYERLGFTAYGAEYDDAGIPHKDMTCPL